MALQKSFETLTGNSGDYWRIDQIVMERKDMKMECRFNLYKSKVDRANGKRQMDEQRILVLNIPSLSTTLAELLSDIYSAAKVKVLNDQALGDVPFFDSATDI